MTFLARRIYLTLGAEYARIRGMQYSPYDLTYVSEIDLLKLILSSADRFPGLYRISSSWEQSLADVKFMKWLDFIETTIHAAKGTTWTKEQWLKAHYDIFESAFGRNSRNDQRQEDDLKVILKQKNWNWFNNADQLRLAVIDTLSQNHELIEGKSYYMMGSIIRFETDKVLIGYDNYSKDTYLQLNIPFSECKRYVDSVFSPDSFNELFLSAEVVGHLHFNDGRGILKVNQGDLDMQFGLFLPNSHVFASVIYKRNLPIQYAKPIGVTSVAKLFR